MVQPLILSGHDEEDYKELIDWGNIRGSKGPTGPLADKLLDDKGVIETVARNGDKAVFRMSEYEKELGYLRPVPAVPTFEQFLKANKKHLTHWSEEEIREEYRIHSDRIARFRDGGEGYIGFGEWDRWEDWLWKEFDANYHLWRTFSPSTRRAWLCLAILGRRELHFQRKGGYTRRDIQHLARVKNRGWGRVVVEDLVRCGALTKIKRRTKQPRYRYTGRLNTKAFHQGLNDWYKRSIKRLIQLAGDAVRKGSKTGARWEPHPPDFYVLWDPEDGELAPPKWVVGALSATLMIAREILHTSLDLPPGHDVQPHIWDPEKLWSRIGKNAMPELRRLCLVAEDVRRDEWKKWMDYLIESDNQPVVLSGLVDMVADPIRIPDEPMPIQEYKPDVDKLFERERQAKKEED